MLTKNELKYYSSLLNKKHRKLEHKFVTEGRKLISEALGSGLSCEIVLINKDYEDDDYEFIPRVSRKARVEYLEDRDFRKVADTENPQGIAAVFKTKNPEPIKDEKLIVALESVSDPGNLGTILRTCDWFGIGSVIASRDTCELYNPKVIRSAMGSAFRMNIVYSENFLEKLEEMKHKGYEILTADLNGESVFEIIPAAKRLLVLSNEASGPAEEVLGISDRIVSIPGKGKAESLNVSVAAGILMAELTR